VSSYAVDIYVSDSLALLAVLWNRPSSLRAQFHPRLRSALITSQFGLIFLANVSFWFDSTVLSFNLHYCFCQRFLLALIYELWCLINYRSSIQSGKHVYILWIFHFTNSLKIQLGPPSIFISTTHLVVDAAVYEPQEIKASTSSNILPEIVQLTESKTKVETSNIKIHLEADHLFTPWTSRQKHDIPWGYCCHWVGFRCQ